MPNVRLKNPLKVYKNSERDMFENMMLTVAMEYGTIPNEEIAEHLDIKDVSQIDKIAKAIREQNIKIAPKAFKKPKSKKVTNKVINKKDTMLSFSKKNKSKESEEDKRLLLEIMEIAKKKLEKNGECPPSAILFRKGVAVKIIRMMFNSRESKLESFQNLRNSIKMNNIDKVITVNDVYVSEYDIVKETKTEKKDALLVRMETKDGGTKIASTIYEKDKTGESFFFKNVEYKELDKGQDKEMGDYQGLFQ